MCVIALKASGVYTNLASLVRAKKTLELEFALIAR